MLEMPVVSFFVPIVKPKKIHTDDQRPEKQLRRKKQQIEELNVEFIQHIDEIV